MDSTSSDVHRLYIKYYDIEYFVKGYILLLKRPKVRIFITWYKD